MAHISKKSSFHFAEIPISRVGLERNPREVGGITVIVKVRFYDLSKMTHFQKMG